MSLNQYGLILSIKNCIKKSMPLGLLGMATPEEVWSVDTQQSPIEHEANVPLKINGQDTEETAFDERVISQLFVGFFNNKMTLPMFLIQSTGSFSNAELTRNATSFFDDIYRHMLTHDQQRRCRLVFKWLRIFFKKLPSVSYKQRQKALMFIYQIYFTLGMHPKFNMGAKK